MLHRVLDLSLTHEKSAVIPIVMQSLYSARTLTVADVTHTDSMS